MPSAINHLKLDSYPWTSVDATGDCWIWREESDRYGRVWDRADSSMVYAHRWIYELLIGVIPAGKVIDHICNVKRCVNPDHLRPITIRENVMRGMHPIYQCKRGHSLEGSNLIKSNRGCRTCVNMNRRARRAAGRAH